MTKYSAGIIISTLLFLFVGTSCKKSNKGISGKLENASGTWVKLQQITETGELTIDSAKVSSDGYFTLKNPADQPDFYLLRTNDTNTVFIVLRKGEKPEITGDANDLETTFTIKGSKDSELLKELRSFDQQLTDSLNAVYESVSPENMEEKQKVGMQLQKTYTAQVEQFAKVFITNNLSSIVSLSATKYLNQQKEIELLTRLEKELVSLYPDNKYVKDYQSLMSGIKQLPAGSPAPEIVLNSPEGQPVALSSFKGKVVLIDFWASWCAPCRRENPNLVELYRNNKAKGFEIYGVSLDDNISAWQNAISADKITWTQVSDLQKWNSFVVKDYHIEAIPYSVLIDKEGKIIAKGLRAEELSVKLNEVLNSL